MAIINNLVMQIDGQNIVVYPNTVGRAVYINEYNGYNLIQALADLRNNATSEWNAIKNKPFTQLSEDFVVEDNILRLNGSFSASWEDIEDKPTYFPTSWTRISSKPSIYPTDWSNVQDKPGYYPTRWNQIENTPNSYPSDWNNITNIPETFNTDWFYVTQKPFNAINGKDFLLSNDGQRQLMINNRFLLVNEDEYTPQIHTGPVFLYNNIIYNNGNNQSNNFTDLRGISFYYKNLNQDNRGKIFNEEIWALDNANFYIKQRELGNSYSFLNGLYGSIHENNIIISSNRMGSYPSLNWENLSYQYYFRDGIFEMPTYYDYNDNGYYYQQWFGEYYGSNHLGIHINNNVNCYEMFQNAAIVGISLSWYFNNANNNVNLTNLFNNSKILLNNLEFYDYNVQTLGTKMFYNTSVVLENLSFMNIYINNLFDMQEIASDMLGNITFKYIPDNIILQYIANNIQQNIENLTLASLMLNNIVSKKMSYAINLLNSNININNIFDIGFANRLSLRGSNYYIKNLKNINFVDLSGVTSSNIYNISGVTDLGYMGANTNYIINNNVYIGGFPYNFGNVISGELHIHGGRFFFGRYEYLSLPDSNNRNTDFDLRFTNTRIYLNNYSETYPEGPVEWYPIMINDTNHIHFNMKNGYWTGNVHLDYCFYNTVNLKITPSLWEDTRWQLNLNMINYHLSEWWHSSFNLGVYANSNFYTGFDTIDSSLSTRMNLEIDSNLAALQIKNINLMYGFTNIYIYNAYALENISINSQNGLGTNKRYIYINGINHLKKINIYGTGTLGDKIRGFYISTNGGTRDPLEFNLPIDSFLARGPFISNDPTNELKIHIFADGIIDRDLMFTNSLSNITGSSNNDVQYISNGYYFPNDNVYIYNDLTGLGTIRKQKISLLFGSENADFANYNITSIRFALKDETNYPERINTGIPWSERGEDNSFYYVDYNNQILYLCSKTNANTQVYPVLTSYPSQFSSSNVPYNPQVLIRNLFSYIVSNDLFSLNSSGSGWSLFRLFNNKNIYEPYSFNFGWSANELMLFNANYENLSFIYTNTNFITNQYINIPPNCKNIFYGFTNSNVRRVYRQIEGSYGGPENVKNNYAIDAAYAFQNTNIEYGIDTKYSNLYYAYRFASMLIRMPNLYIRPVHSTDKYGYMDFAFDNCSNLLWLNFEELHGQINYLTWYNTTNLVSFYLGPNCTLPYESIWQNIRFTGMRNLRYATLYLKNDYGLSSDDAYSYYACDNMFDGCSNLKKVKMEFNRVNYGYWNGTFKGCTNLTDVELVFDLQKTQYYYFYTYNIFNSCNHLENIKISFKNEQFLVNNNGHEIFNSLQYSPFIIYDYTVSLNYCNGAYNKNFGWTNGGMNLIVVQAPFVDVTHDYAPYYNKLYTYNGVIATASNKCPCDGEYGGWPNLMMAASPERPNSSWNANKLTNNSYTGCSTLIYGRITGCCSYSYSGCSNLLIFDIADNRINAMNGTNTYDYYKGLNYSYNGCSNLVYMYMPIPNTTSCYTSFLGCSNLRVLDLRNMYNRYYNDNELLNTDSPYVSMYQNFNSCRNIEIVYLSDYPTNLDGAFSGQSYLRKVVHGNMLTNLASLFVSCINLLEPVNSLCAVNWQFAYQNCEKLTKAVCGQRTLNMAGTYSNCINITEGEFHQSVRNAYCTYMNCYNLINIKGTAPYTIYTSFYGQNLYQAFANCYNLRSFPFKKIINATSLYNTFAGCNNLPWNIETGSLIFNHLSASGAPALYYTFYNCRNFAFDSGLNNDYIYFGSTEEQPGNYILTYSTFSNSGVINVILNSPYSSQVGNVFRDCPDLVAVNCNFDNSWLIDSIFDNCPQLTEDNIDIYAPNAYIWQSCFSNCYNITNAEPLLQKIFNNGTSLTNVVLSYTFANCINLTTVNDWHFDNCASLYCTFYNTPLADSNIYAYGNGVTNLITLYNNSIQRNIYLLNNIADTFLAASSPVNTLLVLDQNYTNLIEDPNVLNWTSINLDNHYGYCEYLNLYVYGDK